MIYYVSYLQSNNQLIGVSNTEPPVLDGVYTAQFQTKIDLDCMTWDVTTLSFVTSDVLSKLEFLTKLTVQERV